MKTYQVTLHSFKNFNEYRENIIYKRLNNIGLIIDHIHEYYEVPIVLLPNNVQLHSYMLERLEAHITIEELQEIK